MKEGDAVMLNLDRCKRADALAAELKIFTDALVQASVEQHAPEAIAQ